MKKTNVVVAFAAISVAVFAESGVEKDSPQDGYSTNMARELGGIVCWDTHWITNVSVPRLDSMYVELEAETNWTRVYYGVSELGYVVTNHVARLVYEGVTNRMKLKTEKSDLAVWRESILTNYAYPPGWNNLTNFYYPNPWVVTNPVIPYYPSNAPIYITNLEIFKNAFLKDPAWKYEKPRY